MRFDNEMDLAHLHLSIHSFEKEFWLVFYIEING